MFAEKQILRTLAVIISMMIATKTTALRGYHQTKGYTMNNFTLFLNALLAVHADQGVSRTETHYLVSMTESRYAEVTASLAANLPRFGKTKRLLRNFNGDSFDGKPLKESSKRLNLYLLVIRS